MFWRLGMPCRMSRMSRYLQLTISTLGFQLGHVLQVQGVQLHALVAQYDAHQLAMLQLLATLQVQGVDVGCRVFQVVLQLAVVYTCLAEGQFGDPGVLGQGSQGVHGNTLVLADVESSEHTTVVTNGQQREVSESRTVLHLETLQVAAVGQDALEVTVLQLPIGGELQVLQVTTPTEGQEGTGGQHGGVDQRHVLQGVTGGLHQVHHLVVRQEERVLALFGLCFEALQQSPALLLEAAGGALHFEGRLAEHLFQLLASEESRNLLDVRQSGGSLEDLFDLTTVFTLEVELAEEVVGEPGGVETLEPVTTSHAHFCRVRERQEVHDLVHKVLWQLGHLVVFLGGAVSDGLVVQPPVHEVFARLYLLVLLLGVFWSTPSLPGLAVVLADQLFRGRTLISEQRFPVYRPFRLQELHHADTLAVVLAATLVSWLLGWGLLVALLAYVVGAPVQEGVVGSVGILELHAVLRVARDPELAREVHARC